MKKRGDRERKWCWWDDVYLNKVGRREGREIETDACETKTDLVRGKGNKQNMKTKLTLSWSQRTAFAPWLCSCGPYRTMILFT